MKTIGTAADDIRVQFKGHLRPFQVTPYQCGNPACLCKKVTLEFIEVEDDGSDVSKPICFRFALSLETWQKRKDTNYNETINALIDEFVHDLSDEIKAMLTEGYEQTKKQQRKLATFTMSAGDIQQGLLVSFSEVMSDADTYDCVPHYGFKITSPDQTYLIDDLYCPNPKCDCKTVNLMFLKYSEKSAEKVTLIDSFLATISLNGKNLTFPDLRKYSESQAAALVRLWQQANPDALDICKHRYNDIRKATKRILKTSRNSFENVKIVRARPTEELNRKADLLLAENEVDELSSSAFLKKVASSIGKTGRNDPCPCGSGKKYKKCCGTTG